MSVQIFLGKYAHTTSIIWEAVRFISLVNTYVFTFFEKSTYSITLASISIFSTNQDTGTQVTPFLVDNKLFLSGLQSEVKLDLTEWIHKAEADPQNNSKLCLQLKTYS